MEKIGCKKLLLYPYAHLSSDLAKPTTAMSLLDEMENNASDLEVSPFSLWLDQVLQNTSKGTSFSGELQSSYQRF